MTQCEANEWAVILLNGTAEDIQRFCEKNNIPFKDNSPKEEETTQSVGNGA